MALLTVENLSFSFPGDTTGDAAGVAADDAMVLSDVSFSLEEGSFTLLCGASGCGKTTLLRLIKRSLAPHGKESGRVLWEGIPMEELPPRRQAGEIGFVLQDPDAQIVTDRIWHELAFGLESLGTPPEEIRLRVGEMANYFGITPWFRESTDSLSGGQKQLLNLASVMVMSPRLLLLDEPTSQLDPIAAGNFLATLKKLNRELGITVLLVEHRLEEVFPLADRVLVLENGRLIADDTPRAVCADLGDDPIAKGFPTAVRVFAGLGGRGESPLTVGEGKKWLRERCAPARYCAPAMPEDPKPVLTMERVWFRYEREGRDILRGADLAVNAGEIHCLLGGNGAGKTTALRLLTGLSRPLRGKVCFLGKDIRRLREEELRHGGISLLPQGVRQLFLKPTLREDYADFCAALGYTPDEGAEKTEALVSRLHLGHLTGRHPLDLSGGEAQRAGLLKALLPSPRVLLLDEPTKGLDAAAALELSEILRELRAQGMAILIVTHDVEFAARFADRISLCFDGEILPPASPGAFFSHNHFYTTAASRLSRELFGETVTTEAVIAWGREHPTGAPAGLPEV